MRANKAMCDLLGYTSEELQRLRTSDVTHPDDRSIRASVPLAERRILQKRYLTKHGNVLHARVAFTLLQPVTDDSPGCSLNQFIDISSEVIARNTSEQHQTLLHSLFQDSMVPIALTVRRSDPFLDVNEAFSRLLGYSREELLSMAPEDLGPKGESDRASIRLAEAVSAGHTRLTLDRRYETKDGRTVDTVMNVAWNDGSPRTYASQLVDVTELNIERKARLQSEAMFETAFESSPLGMAVITEQGRFALVNAELASMLGTDRASLIGEQLVAGSSEVATALAAGFTLVGAGSLEPFRTEVEFTRSGETRMAGITLRAVPSADDHVHHVIALVVDVTASLQARRQLEKVLQSKNEFIASASHELRTPLSVIVGLTAELRSNIDSFNGSERDELVAILSEQADEMADLIEDLLTSGRLDAASLRLAPRSIVFSEMVGRLIAAIPGEARSAISLDISDSELTADPVRLRQILRNLVSNASRYGGPNTWIRTLDGTDDEFVAVVEDDGTGIPYNEWQEIFEPYQRATTSEGQPGAVGLGLTVSRRLAQIMGGSLEYSHADGRSRFTLRLPRTGVTGT